MSERYQKLPPMIVEPAYSPEDRVWFLDDGTTARSLSELQRKLPHAVIEGYYPKGYAAERSKDSMAAREFRWSQMRSPKYTRKGPAPSVSKSEPVFEKEEPEIIKAVFEPPPEKIAVPEPEPVKEEVVVAPPPLPPPPPEAPLVQVQAIPVKKNRNRSTGRGRTHNRIVGSNKRSWSPEQDLELYNYVEQGLSCDKIGVKIGRTRNAVVGRCHRKGYQLKGKKRFVGG